jgi:hypothetical protein
MVDGTVIAEANALFIATEPIKDAVAGRSPAIGTGSGSGED